MSTQIECQFNIITKSIEIQQDRPKESTFFIEYSNIQKTFLNKYDQVKKKHQMNSFLFQGKLEESFELTIRIYEKQSSDGFSSQKMRLYSKGNVTITLKNSKSLIFLVNSQLKMRKNMKINMNFYIIVTDILNESSYNSIYIYSILDNKSLIDKYSSKLITQLRKVNKSFIPSEEIVVDQSKSCQKEEILSKPERFLEDLSFSSFSLNSSLCSQEEDDEDDEYTEINKENHNNEKEIRKNIKKIMNILENQRIKLDPDLQNRLEDNPELLKSYIKSISSDLKGNSIVYNELISELKSNCSLVLNAFNEKFSNFLQVKREYEDLKAEFMSKSKTIQQLEAEDKEKSLIKNKEKPENELVSSVFYTRGEEIKDDILLILEVIKIIKQTFKDVKDVKDVKESSIFDVLSKEEKEFLLTLQKEFLIDEETKNDEEENENSEKIINRIEEIVNLCYMDNKINMINIDQKSYNSFSFDGLSCVLCFNDKDVLVVHEENIDFEGWILKNFQKKPNFQQKTKGKKELGKEKESKKEKEKEKEKKDKIKGK